MNASLNKPKPSRTYGGLSQAQRMSERRERFLEAGLEIFGTVGLHGATVRKLCKSAGLTERYFYQCFDDTEALFCAVYQKQTETLQTLFMTALPSFPKELEPRIEACLDLFFSSMRNDRLVRVLNLESLSGTPNISAMHHANTQKITDVAAHMIRLDNPDLEASHALVSTFALALTGACISCALQWMLGGYTTAQETLVKACTMLVLGSMRELLGNNTPVTHTPD